MHLRPAPRVLVVFGVVGALLVLGGVPLTADLKFSAPATAEPLLGEPPLGEPLPAPPTPDTDHCPHREHTPPPVDESEAVRPGASPVADLPVPEPPIGGDQLAECGVIAGPGGGPIPPGLTAAGWLIADMDSGDVLAAKDPHGRYRPASTIKVLLALVVLEEIDREGSDLDLDTVVEPKPQDWHTVGDSCGLAPGGKYTVRDLLSGLMVVSGNDCAEALARTLGGREKALAAMNDRAETLSALDTRAASPSGLDAAGMSTSPYDLALIFSAAMQHKTFQDLIALQTYEFPGHPPRPDVPDDEAQDPYPMYTTNQLLLNDSYPGMLGGKTGYTDNALRTFVGVTERDGRRILIVQMYGLSVEGDSYWDQARSMFEYGFQTGPQASVGRLVTPTTPAAPSTPAQIPEPTAAPSVSDSVSDVGISANWSVRALIGLLAALLAIVLLLVGLKLFGRQR